MSKEIASFEGNISDLIVQPDYVWHNGEWRDVTTAKMPVWLSADTAPKDRVIVAQSDDWKSVGEYWGDMPSAAFVAKWDEEENDWRALNTPYCSIYAGAINGWVDLPA